jgi:ferric-dicitrate binding protein FerR (iron transport regulator)
MALSLPGLDADLVASLKSGNLGALEKLFRAAYPALLAKAKETLDDDVAASRVVERLIPRIYAERATLSTPDALASSLEALLHESAVRERSRLAGIRKRDDGGKKSTGGAPSADEVWRRIATTVQGPTAAQLAEASQMKEKLRHEAGAHIKKMTKGTPMWVNAGAGVLILGVVVGIFYFFQKSGETGRLSRQVNSVDVRELRTGTGQRGNVTLDDGTTAKFGADTKVRVPSKFGELVRGVGLEGAAEFTVAQDPVPFQVLAKNVEITAVGTVFAVSSYPQADHVIIRVKEGSVKVLVIEPTESEQTLTAGQTLLVNADGTTAAPNEQQLAVALGYLEDQFVIAGENLKTVLAEIKRWYGTDLFLMDTTLGNRMIDSLRAPLGSSADAIKAIEAASGLVAGWEGQTRVLKEKGK